MRWLLRPSSLIFLSVALAVGAAGVVLLQRDPEMGPLPLQDGDQEIVWLYAATSAAAWDRFVTAVETAAQRLQTDYPDLQVQITAQTFPLQTTSVPELALVVRGGSSRLVFRWYKLTADQRTDRWVEQLLAGRRRPPLAILGGASSDLAIEQARSLERAVRRHPEAAPPLLLLTTATAGSAQESLTQGVPLSRIYGGRTFRFCFTNHQMAEAVTHFIWSHDELRPDEPAYMVVWEDDAYSKDLIGRFSDALRPRMSPDSLPVAEYIDYSVGTFDQPNRWEAPVIGRLVRAKLRDHPGQKRPLLVLPAAAQGPARRFLRGLARASPNQARRFVVATGDGLAFNTVYRDRAVAWPIQDLPFDLVFFCHRNPVDVQAGFRPEGGIRPGPGGLVHLLGQAAAGLAAGSSGAPLGAFALVASALGVAEADTFVPPTRSGLGSPSTGTEDLLLYEDIIKALVHAVYQGTEVPRTGDELRERLVRARWKNGGVSFDDDGQFLFDDEGNRRTGTGEHVVWLHPWVRGEQVLPRSTIEVWAWRAEGPPGQRWTRYTVLAADYQVGGDLD